MSYFVLDGKFKVGKIRSTKGDGWVPSMQIEDKGPLNGIIIILREDIVAALNKEVAECKERNNGR